MKEILRRLWKEEEGQGMAEYGLILALVAIAVIGVLILLGNRVSNRIGEVANNLA